MYTETPIALLINLNNKSKRLTLSAPLFVYFQNRGCHQKKTEKKGTKVKERQKRKEKERTGIRVKINKLMIILRKL